CSAGPTATGSDASPVSPGRRCKARRRIGSLGAGVGGTVAVPHHRHHVIAARRQGQELLEDYALVAAERLLEVADAHLLVAADLPHRYATGAVGPERCLDVVLRGDLGGPA